MMKNLDNKKENCPDIQDLLIKKLTGDITEEENTYMERHLESCINCKAFGLNLKSIQDDMKVPSAGGLTPDTAVYYRAVEKMKEQNKIPQKESTPVWQLIAGILKYRIPAYQVGLGVILAGIIFFSADKIQRNQDSINKDILETLQKKDIEIETVSIQNDIFVVERQKLAGILNRKNPFPDSILQIFNYHF
ncbi:hypothetical protein ACFL40_00470 [candidate division KSB1 bacterium]